MLIQSSCGRAPWILPQAPVPYLNRAIAKETLGVEAAQRGDSPGAQALWRSAAEDASRAIELDPKEFAAYFDRWAPLLAACLGWQLREPKKV